MSAELEPKSAALLARDEIDTLRIFANNLINRGETLGLIGPRENERIWSRHLINSALLAPLLRPGSSVSDIGTGGGFPGLVLAIIRPDVKFHLVEPMERRTLWLDEQVKELDLKNVEVLRNRGEELHGELQTDYVSARAVSALKKLIPVAAPLVKDGGELIFLKGAQIDQEIENAKAQIKKFKLTNPRVETLGEGVAEETTRVFRATVEKKKKSQVKT